MNFLAALRMIISWSLVGAFSAYTLSALYTFTYTFIVMTIIGEFPPWFIYSILYGVGSGFLVGLVKAALTK